MAFSYVEPSMVENYWDSMEQEVVYEKESSYCIAGLFASVAESESAPLVNYYDQTMFVPQNTVETDVEINPYCVNLADLFASESERTVVEESEQDSIIAEPYYTCDLYATLIETEGCRFISRSLVNDQCFYDLDNFMTVETIENAENVQIQDADLSSNDDDSVLESEGHIMTINETCVRIEEKNEYLAQMLEEPVFTQ